MTTGRGGPRAIATLLGVCLGVCGAVTGAGAQGSIRWSAALEGFATRLNTEIESAPARFSGPSFGGAGTISWWRLGLELRYLEGALTPSGGGEGRHLVEGEAFLTFRPLSWVRLKGGPHVRSFILNTGTERWVFWEARLRTEAKLAFPRLRTYLEAWQVLGSDVRVPDPYGTGRGLEGGMRWEVGRLPFSVTLAYRFDRSTLADGTREEVLEHVILAFGVGGRERE